MDRKPPPDVLQALFGPLPDGWRERKGLLPDPAAPRLTTAAKTAAANAGPPPRIPGAPETPWQLSRASWIELLKRTAKEFSQDRVSSVAGGVTFFALLSLFPAITALVSLYALVADPVTIADGLANLHRVLPDSAIDLISGQIIAIAAAPKSALTVAGLLAILIALWSANGGMKALIEALNIAWFETEKRGFIRLNLVSLAMTLGAILGVLVMLAAIAVVPAFLKFVFLGSAVEALVSFSRWPLMFLILMLGLAVIYRFGPSKDDPQWQWISPGALVASVGLLTASLGFSWYAGNFASYNETYGSLGAAVAMMMWLWIAAIVVLMGAELNSEVERQIKVENGVTPKDDSDLKQN